MTKTTSYEYLRQIWDEYKAGCLNKKECVIWPRALTSTGYGAVGLQSRCYRAPRLIIQWKLGLTEYWEIPKGIQALHAKECTSRACVNPHHIYPGSHKNNMWDHFNKWQDWPTSKLSVDDVRAIKKALKNKSVKHATLAKFYRVRPTTISKINTGETWYYV